jgi:hypothetical protein
VAELSGLTKKAVYADKVLAKILSVNEGDHVSYAELSRGLHKYIKENHLKELGTQSSPVVSGTLVPSQQVPTPASATVITVAVTKKCKNCMSEIPVGAAFCDLCGLRQ